MTKDAARDELKYIIRKQKSVTTSRLKDLLHEIGFYRNDGFSVEEAEMKRQLQSVENSRDSYKKKVKKLENKIAGLYRRENQRSTGTGGSHAET